MNTIIANLVISLLLILATHPALAGSEKVNKSSKSVNAKCHVALASGHQDILLYRIKANKLKSLPQRINGSKVATRNSNKKVSVLKVYECAMGGEEFSSARAKLLDKNLPR